MMLFVYSEYDTIPTIDVSWGKRTHFLGMYSSWYQSQLNFTNRQKNQRSDGDAKKANTRVAKNGGKQNQ